METIVTMPVDTALQHRWQPVGFTCPVCHKQRLFNVKGKAECRKHKIKIHLDGEWATVNMATSSNTLVPMPSMIAE